MQHAAQRSYGAYHPLASLVAFKTQAFRLLIPCGMLVVIVDWATNQTHDTLQLFDQVSSPLLLILGAILEIVLLLRPGAIALIAKIIFIALAVYTVLDLSIILAGGPQHDPYRLANTPEWLPIVSVAALFAFEIRHGLLIALGFHCLLLCGGALLLAQDMGRLSSADIQLLLKLYLSSALSIPMLSCIALLRKHYTKLIAYIDLMSRVAYRDDLTKSYNRRYLDAALQQALDLAQRYARPLAVILLDIDHFKQINDTWGHASGDIVLADISTTLQQQLRSADTFGRWGGEEFLIIAPETNLDQAQALAERLRAIIAAQSYLPAAQITISLGVASYASDTFATLLQRADDALYRAKQQGRNRVGVANHMADRGPASGQAARALGDMAS